MPCELRGDELRKRVAELRGWTNLRRFHFGDGELVLAGDEPGGAPTCKVPYWQENPTTAMELVDEMNADERFGGVTLYYVPSVHEWRAMKTTSDAVGRFAAGTSLPEAISRLYVAWKEATK